MSLAFTRNPKLPLKLRRRVGKIFGKPPSGKEFHLKILDVDYFGTTGNHMDNKIYLYGCHEAATIRLIRELLIEHKNKGKDPVYLDIGTNTGLHLITAAPYADKAYGFEPFEPIREKALNNIKRNNLDFVHLYPFGLSDKDAELPYSPPTHANLGTGHFSKDEHKQSGSETIILDVRKGDDVLSNDNIVPTMIKIDVEGFEEFALRGLSQTIQSHKPDIIFEYNAETRRHNPDVLTAIQDILGADYSYHGICRSRELPKLVTFQESGRYENVLASTSV